MLFHVDRTTHPDGAALTAHGEIDLATVGALRDAIARCIQDGARHLTLDLNRVTYIDSSGLGALIGAHKRLHAAGGTLTVNCAEARILRLIKLTGIDRVLTIQAATGTPAPDAAV